MLPTNSSFIQKLLPGYQNVQQKLPTLPQQAVTQQPTPQGNNQNNPFMIGMNRDNPQFMGYYGVNRPLKEPMFLGYKDNKALYGGSKLFILY